MFLLKVLMKGMNVMVLKRTVIDMVGFPCSIQARKNNSKNRNTVRSITVLIFKNANSYKLELHKQFLEGFIFKCNIQNN